MRDYLWLLIHVRSGSSGFSSLIDCLDKYPLSSSGLTSLQPLAEALAGTRRLKHRAGNDASFPLTATGGALALYTLLGRKSWLRALLPSLSLREPHRLVVRVVGRPRPEALIGVEVHGVDFLPANVLKSYSCLIWRQQGLREGCSPIDRKARTSDLDPPVGRRWNEFVLQCTSVRECKCVCVKQKQSERARPRSYSAVRAHL